LRRTAVLFSALTVLTLAAAGCSGPKEQPIEEVETRIREILSLATYEHVYRDVVYVGEEARFLGIPTKDKRTLFSIDVNVRAGIDFTEGIDVSVGSDGTALVKLPPAKILSIDADEGTIHQYFVKDLGGNLSRIQYYEEINRKKEFLEADAVERGILVKAEDNAKLLIRNFLALAGFEQVEFEDLPKSAPRREENSGKDTEADRGETAGGGTE
jgi:hypothetical protein